MSDFGTVFASYWSRGSGKAMRGNRNARFLGLYLLTAPCATEIGLYYLPFVTLCHEMEFTPEEAREAIQACSEAKFAHYDEDAELVWIPNAAEKRFGVTLSAGDRKRKWIGKQVAAHGNHRFVRQFMTRYGEGYGLLPGSPDPNLQMPHPMPHPMPPSSLLSSPLSSGVVVCVSGSPPDLTPPVAIPAEAASGIHEVSEPEPETSRDRYIRAYCAGIAKGKGGPFAWSGSQYDLGDLGQVISVFAHELKSKKPLRGERLLGWIEDAACDFATWVGEQKDPETPRYYSAYRPKGCLKFLNEQERGEEARRVG